MTNKQFFLLLLLAAIWGASFLLIRIAVDSFAPVFLIEARVLFAALSLSIIALLMRRKVMVKGLVGHYFFVGLFNSAIPWMLFAYAAQTLTVAMLAILNATAPIWGSLIGRFWHGERIPRQGWCGLGLGILGVVLMVGLAPNMINAESLTALLAATFAAFCYGIATNYTKHVKHKVPGFDTSHGSLCATVILLVPLLPFFPVNQMPSTDEILAVVLLGIVCTGIALIFYFDLVAEIGAASALSVTFLIPGFAAIWGYVVLGEVLTLNVLVGIITVLLGTMLVTGFSPMRFLKKRKGDLQPSSEL
ncbi:DMT family transporter [Pseudoalteromonas sp. MMG024]|uniref:DMT family transporter n=1 Tax=Pseudoalteromonas sp. MMG024 TaxID=2909980 RepID=UPI001F491369|nr:DMT family transporter [Pseudoalteromonas sp. MMG024]MCF6457179.1 DMT family transporter [Pseudoalteromonas sp. MMG024]